MTRHSPELVGAVLADLTRHALCAAAEDEPYPAVRVVGASVTELQQLLTDLFDTMLPGRDEPVRVVVGGAEPGTLSPAGDHQLILDRDQPLTRYRNDLVERGTVLISLGQQPDAEGLRTLFTIGDQTALRATGSDMATIEGRVDRLTDVVWRFDDDLADVPGVIKAALNAVFDAYRRTEGAPSLRSWLGYLDAVRITTATLDVVDETTAARAARAALDSLDLFPDHADGPFGTSSLRTRVRKNIHMSRSSDPNGRWVEDKDVLARIEASTVADDIKARMAAFVEGDQDARTDTPFDDWLSVFETKATLRKGLGTKIRDYVDAKKPVILNVLDDLDAVEALNAGGDDAVSAAEDLVSAANVQTEDGPLSLYSSLSKTLRKQVDRLLSSSHTVSDPLIGILRRLTDLPDDGSTVVIEIVGKTDTTRFSRLAFGALYAPTLRDVADDDTGTRTLDVSALPGLADVATARDELCGDADEDRDGDDSGSGDAGWGDIGIRITVHDDGGSTVAEHTLAWGASDKALLLRMLLDPPVGSALTAAEAADLVADAASPGSPLPEADEPFQSIPRAFAKARTGFFAAVAANGLYALDALAYVEAYEAATVELVAERVPDATPDPVVEEFASMDVVEMGPRSLMLGIHPIRLRWFAHHLQEVRRLLVAALGDELRLNDSNPDLFFDRLERLRPVSTPALASRVGHYLEPIRSDGPEALFAPMRRGEETSVSIDRPAIDVLARVAKRYVEEFPHKRDGLSILVIDREGSGGLVEQLVRRIVQTCGDEVVLRVEIAAPKASHAWIASSLADLADDREGVRRLVPAFVTVLHDFDDVVNGEEAVPADIDIAYAPDLFGANVDTNEMTRGVEEGSAGRHDPWMGRPDTRVAMPGSPTAVRELLPTEPDPLLEAWSTMSVRRKRSSPVGSPDAVDYLRTHVNFASQLDFFSQLHRSAHWVVTLDEYLSREQFDAIPNPPDVLMVEEAVGANGSFALTVSSDDGRAFVVGRLSVRLGPDSLRISGDPEQRIAIAHGLFDLGRNVAPSLMLRALGLGRTAEETVGLVVGRFRLESLDDERDVDVDAWINLDDHSHWFGGHKVLRADLLRASFRLGDVIKLDLEVVESKFRKTNDLGKAEEQVVSTADRLADAFGGTDKHDARIWGHELATAISQLPRSTRGDTRLPAMRTIDEPDVDIVDLVCRQLRAGRFELDSITGTIVHTNAEGGKAGTEHLDVDVDDSALDTIRIIRTDRPLLKSTLAEIGGVDLTDTDTGPDGPADGPGHRTGGTGAPTDDDPDPQPDGGSGATTSDTGNQTVSPAPVDNGPSPGSATVTDTTPEPAPAESAPVNPDPTRGATEPVTDERGIGIEGLRQNYQRVLDTYSEHGVKVVAVDEGAYAEGPAFYRLRLRPAKGTNAKSLQSNIDDIRLALELEAEHHIRTYLDLGAVVLEVPKSSVQRYPVVAEDLWEDFEQPDTGLVVPLGADMDGEPVTIDFSSSKSPHLLIAGTTGSGKSVALETILTGLCQRYGPEELRLRLVDPKRVELSFLEDDDHADGEIGVDAGDAVEILDELVEEMDRRYTLLKPTKTTSLMDYNALDEVEPLPWFVCVLDEYADLTSASDDLKAVEPPLQRVTQKGRAAGIHVIIATQRPSADILTTRIRSNLPARLALRSADAGESRVILGEGGAEALAGDGDALFQTPGGTVRVQCAALRARLA